MQSAITRGRAANGSEANQTGQQHLTAVALPGLDVGQCCDIKGFGLKRLAGHALVQQRLPFGGARHNKADPVFFLKERIARRVGFPGVGADDISCLAGAIGTHAAAVLHMARQDFAPAVKIAHGGFAAVFQLGGGKARPAIAAIAKAFGVFQIGAEFCQHRFGPGLRRHASTEKREHHRDALIDTRIPF